MTDTTRQRLLYLKAQQEADGISFYFDEKVLGKNVLVSKKSITKPLNNKCIYA